jgi:hypothetical protein
MIKCYFVDVKSISSTVPKSKFKKAEIDRLADAMLAADGLLRPLILQQAGVEKYTVIEGHREYYAAVRAKEKDIKKAEMVNAFIIDANFQKSAIEQLTLLTGSQTPIEISDPDLDTQTLTDLVEASIDRLLPQITAAISIQLQPIVSQLADHQQILKTIKLALVNKPTDESEKLSKAEETTQSVSILDVLKSEVEPPKEIKPKIDRQKDSKPVETLGSDSPKPKQAKATKTTPKSSKKVKPADETSASIPVAIAPQTQTAATIPAKETKPVETKSATTSGSTGSAKATIALDLINNLSKDELLIKVERSGVRITKDIVDRIILKRASQPAQKFASCDDLSVLKIKGLTAAKIQEIIKKLK